MSDNADELDIQDVHPETPAAEPVIEAPVTPAPEPVPVPSPAPTDKVQQPDISNHQIPKWRLDEVLEQNRLLKAQLQQVAPRPQTPAAPEAPKPDQFSTYEEYIRAEAAHQAKQAAREEWQTLQQQSSRSQQEQAFQERLTKAETDYHTDVFTAAQKNPTLIQKLQNTPQLRPDLFLALQESKARVALAEHLADNPAMVLQMNQMRPDQGLRTLIETEFKLTAVTGGPQKKPSAQAPDLDPVGGGNQPVKKNPYSADASVEEFIFGTSRVPGKS